MFRLPRSGRRPPSGGAAAAPGAPGPRRLGWLAAMLIFAGPAHSQGSSDATHLLRRAVDASAKLAVAGRQTVTSWDEADADVVVSEEYRSGRGQTRSAVVLPHAQRGNLSIRSGQVHWEYDARTRTLTRGQVGTVEELQPDLALLERNYRVVLDPRPDTVAGREARILSLEAVVPGKPLRRLWLDAATGFPLRVDKIHAGGEHQSRSEYQLIHFPDSLPRALFLPPRADVRRVIAADEAPVSLEAAAAALGVAPARELPAGYRLRGVARHGEDDPAVYHFRYDDGLSVVSLFISRSSGPLPGPAGASNVNLPRGQARIQTDGHFRVLAWRQGALQVSLVADTTPELLTRLADASGLGAGAKARAHASPFLDTWILLPASVLFVALLLWVGTGLVQRRRLQSVGGSR